MLRLDSKNLPEQTYNDTVAMAIGRKSDLSSYILIYFLTQSWDRKPRGVTQYNLHNQSGTQHGIHEYTYALHEYPHPLCDFVEFGLVSDQCH